MLTVNIQKQLTHFKLAVQFEVGNEIIALFGPSGSGKTTILNCIAGLCKPDAGIISLNKKILFHNGKEVIPIQNREVGYLFQDYALFPHMTVWKNIAYGMKTEKFAAELMKELHIEHLKNEYPHNISGGEKQRVALARALATEPKLLLLDEPFSALDDKTRLVAHDELLRIHEQWNIPVIIVTHNRTEAEKLSQRILHMNDGEIIS